MDINNHDLNELSDIIENTAHSLYNAMRYIYIIGEDDFYNINVKDIFKVSLSDVTNPDILINLNINNENDNLKIEQVKNMLHYAFAIRLPFLRRTIPNCPLKENHLKELYSIALKRGADNFNGIIEGDLRFYLKAIKNRLDEPPFDSEWFRRWVYTTGHNLAAINNKNMFLLGCVDALFPLFYSALTEKITTAVSRFIEIKK